MAIDKPRFFAIRNLSASETFIVDDPAAMSARHQMPTEFRTKAERVAWANRPATRHCFISGFEAANPNLRVNPRSGNPAYRMHALIADYDAYCPSHGTLEEILNREFNGDPDFRPNWAVTTRSGGKRLIWQFAEPLGIDAPKFVEPFLRHLKKELRVHRLLAGLDEAAYLSSHTYYEIGSDWLLIQPVPLSHTFLVDAFGEAVIESSKRFVKGAGLPEIPMEKIHAEFESKFPGRLGVPLADFIPGCRGPAAWDSSAKNPTSCVYYPYGVYRYSSDKIFHSYTEILGEGFTRQFERERTGSATESIYYLGSNHYVRVVEDETTGSRTFLKHQKDEVKDFLKVEQKMNPKNSNVAGGNEIDRGMLLIQQLRTVDFMAPILWNPNLLVETGHQRILNCSNNRVLTPSDEPAGKWGERFPWTARWLFGLFEPRSQLLRLLLWMRHAYSHALNHDPTRNLALFFVGSTNLGKTLWNQIWWPYIMGSGCEGTQYLTGKDPFNKALASSAHWYVDDARASSSERESQTFTETLKALIANPTVSYRPMYTDPTSIPYNGTICVTLNEDDLSLQMLPSLDRNVVDKVLILRCATPEGKTVFDAYAEEKGQDALFSDALKREAPAFLRWLLDWTPPKRLTRGAMRFGTPSYVHPDLLRASVANSSAGDLLAVIDTLINDDAAVAEEVKENGYYDCTAMQLLHVMSANPLTNKVLGTFGSTARGVGIRLAKLAKLHATRVVNLRQPGKKVAGNKQNGFKGEPTKYRLFPLGSLERAASKKSTV